jgi:hypothetical protein
VSFVDSDGFLSGRIDEWVTLHRAANEELFSLAESLNRDCHRFLEKHEVGTFESRQLTTMVLFLRLLELYQGIVLHALRGLRSPTRILLRSFLEAYFHFEAIHSDSAYLEDYLNQLEFERKSLINRMRRTTDKGLESLRRPIDAALIAEIETIKFPKVTVDEVAKRGGNYPIYLTAYAMLSRSVHSSAADLEDHLAVENEGKAVVGFRYGPSEIETVRAVGLAGIALGEVLEQMGKDFEDDVSLATKPVRAAFEKLLGVTNQTDSR